MKTCLKCGETKSLDQFGVHKQKPDGLRSYCKPCNRAEARAWTAANPEKAKARSRQWDIDNPERARAIKRRSFEKHYPKYKANVDMAETTRRAVKWAAENKERSDAIKKRWAARNVGKVNAAAGRRNADRAKATPKWLSAVQLAQIEEFYEIAIARTTQTGVKHEVDHVHPLRGGNFAGLHVPWNLQVLTRSENIRKSNRLIGDA